MIVTGSRTESWGENDRGGWRARVEKFMLTLLCDRLHNDRIMEADVGTPGPRAQTAG